MSISRRVGESKRMPNTCRQKAPWLTSCERGREIWTKTFIFQRILTDPENQAICQSHQSHSSCSRVRKRWQSQWTSDCTPASGVTITTRGKSGLPFQQSTRNNRPLAPANVWTWIYTRWSGRSASIRGKRWRKLTSRSRRASLWCGSSWHSSRKGSGKSL